MARIKFRLTICACFLFQGLIILFDAKTCSCNIGTTKRTSQVLISTDSDLQRIELIRQFPMREFNIILDRNV